MGMGCWVFYIMCRADCRVLTSDWPPNFAYDASKPSPNVYMTDSRCVHDSNMTHLPCDKALQLLSSADRPR